MDIRDMIAETILANKTLLGRYLAGFDDQSRTRQAPGLPNHAAWSLGHLALTMHRAAEKIDGTPPPPSDFTPGHPPAGASGPPSAFWTESVAFGSTPTDTPAHYPSLARCTAIFHAACDRVAAAVRAASMDQLKKEVPWGAGTTPLWLLAQRMSFHNGMHTGQIADLRRALGMKSIFS